MIPERWKQIDELVQAALERRPEDRSAFLDQACKGDDALREEVQSLLGYDERASRFIENPPDNVAAIMMAAEPMMESLVGRTLGHYQVLSLLGAGGMGEVYRARDTRLDRIIALKILPSDVAADEQRMRRFVHEAKAASTLNHPSVAHIYEIGEADGVSFIAMEYVEGQTLATKIGDRPLEIVEVIEIGIQTTDALDEAHGKGITHRDLKPANIMVTPRGQVKVLDFGLAKINRPVEQDVDTSLSTLMQTSPGVVVGTLPYMSPEQALGRDVDQRSDIFSIGAVLYELATARRPFSGMNASETLDLIVNAQPKAISCFNALAPAELERIVRKCLEKDREDRYQSARELLVDLRNFKRDSGSGKSAAAAKQSETLRARLASQFWPAAAVAIVLAAVLVYAFYLRRAPAESHATYTYLPLPEKTKNYSTGASAISPDAKHVAVAATGGLWLYSFDAPAPLLLAGTEDAGMPFWSPDGRSIGFHSQGKLKRIELSGGIVTALCDSSFIWGGAWSSTGVIIFSPASWGYGLYRVSESGGPATPLTSLDAARLEMGQSFPSFLPDGRHFICFSKAGQPEYRGIRLGSLDSSQTSFLFRADAKAEYSTAGYLLFMRARKILAQKFDPEKLVITGDPVVVIERAHSDVNNLGTDLSVSGDRALLYCRGGSLDGQLVWLARNGGQLATVGPAAEFFSLQLSPNGRQAFLERNDPQVEQNDIWQLDLRRETLSRLTSNPARDLCPILSPDESRMVFISNREGFWGLYEKGVIGDDKEELLLRGDQRLMWTSDWSRDGKFIVYSKLNEITGRDIMVLPLFGDRQPHNYLATQFYESWGKVSPDGRWLAYQSNESGRDEICVQSFPETGRKVLVSKGGGQFPRWRSDGKELYYVASDDRLMAVPVETGASFAAGAPLTLFEVGSYSRRSNRYTYDVSPDGQRFLVIRPQEDASARPLTVVQNWTAELKR